MSSQNSKRSLSCVGGWLYWQNSLASKWPDAYTANVRKGFGELMLTKDANVADKGKIFREKTGSITSLYLIRRNRLPGTLLSVKWPSYVSLSPCALSQRKLRVSIVVHSLRISVTFSCRLHFIFDILSSSMSISRVNCCWPSPAQSFIISGPAGLKIIF
jgi:hypothetical protein